MWGMDWDKRFAKALTASIRERGGSKLCVLHPKTGAYMLIEPGDYELLLAKVEAEEFALEHRRVAKRLRWSIKAHALLFWGAMSGLVLNLISFGHATTWWALPAALACALIAEFEYGKVTQHQYSLESHLQGVPPTARALP